MKIREYLIRQIKKLGDDTDVDWRLFDIETLLKRIEMLENEKKEIN